MIVILLLCVVVLLLLNAFFVLAEFASVKVRPSRVEELIEDGDPRAPMVRHVLQHIDEYLSVCQLGITFASIGLGFAGKPAFATMALPLVQWAGAAAPQVAQAAAITIAYFLVAFLHILLGELVPKAVAIRHPSGSALQVARALAFFRVIFFVPLKILNGCQNLILRMMGCSVQVRDDTHSEDELRIILERSQTTGLMPFRRLLLLENVFDIGEVKVRNAMRPRRDAHVLRLGASWEENFRTIAQSRLSRFPLVDGDTGKPIGIIHIKDLFLIGPEKMATADLRALARPIITTTEETPLENFWAELQHRRRHMAIVLNQEGQWTGVITMEDVIEEIVGAIEDEFAMEQPMFLADLLNQRRIALNVRAATPREAITQIIASSPASELPAPAEKILKLVLEREQAMSTYLGDGLATPHARLEGLAAPVLLFGRSDPGVPVGGKGEKAHLFFILLTPAENPRVQVRLLGRIAGLMSSEYVVERLREASTPQAVLEIIRAGDPIALG